MTLAVADPRWRHRRVWLDPHSLGGLREGWHGEQSDLHAVIAWAEARRPFVGRATTPCDRLAGGSALVPLGLAHAGDGHKHRVGFLAPARSVEHSLPPLALSEVLKVLPASHGQAAASVLDAMQPLGVQVAVYGSAFWSHACGELQMRATSDLDLLLTPGSAPQLERMLAELMRLDRGLKVRLDGEVSLPDCGTVAWRELAAKPPSILVKTDLGPQLRNPEQIWAQWR